jgi:hypothetical protein
VYVGSLRYKDNTKDPDWFNMIIKYDYLVDWYYSNTDAYIRTYKNWILIDTYHFYWSGASTSTREINENIKDWDRVSVEMQWFHRCTLQMSNFAITYWWQELKLTEWYVAKNWYSI